jgi:copper chaperone CopZ
MKCRNCGKTIKNNIQSLRAHLRWCPSRPPPPHQKPLSPNLTSQVKIAKEKVERKERPASKQTDYLMDWNMSKHPPIYLDPVTGIQYFLALRGFYGDFYNSQMICPNCALIFSVSNGLILNKAIIFCPRCQANLKLGVL